MTIIGEYYKYAGRDFPSEEVILVSSDYPYVQVRRSNGETCTVNISELSAVNFSKQPDMLLPTDAQERKQIPLITGLIDYFPLACAEVAKCSLKSNEQHNPGQPLHWDRTKSTDHIDCIGRHIVDRGKFDTDGQRHSAKLAWRALALLQLELESEKNNVE